MGPAVDASFGNGNRYIVGQVSLLYRSPSFVHVASTAGTAIDIENRAGCANKRPYHSLVTFSLWDQPNVASNRPLIPYYNCSMISFRCFACSDHRRRNPSGLLEAVGPFHDPGEARWRLRWHAAGVGHSSAFLEVSCSNRGRRTSSFQDHWPG